MKRLFLVIFIAACGSTVFCASLKEISLPSIAQEKFDGRGLKLIKTLATTDAYIRYYITYMSGDLKISGILNIPKGKGPFPVVITAHGFIDPKYYTNGRGLKREQDYLARHGYAVLHPDYRNHAASDKDPDNSLRLNLGYTEDVINAIYAIKSSTIEVLDRSNIGLLGHSLGGGVALNMMVAKPGLVKAYVLFAPISMDYRENFERWIGRHSHNMPAKYGSISMREKIIKAYGSPDANPDFWFNISPMTFLKNITEPILIHQGTADKDVPPQWSAELKKALDNNEKDAIIFSYKGEPHEFVSAWPVVMERSVKFFDKHLRP